MHPLTHRGGLWTRFVGEPAAYGATRQGVDLTLRIWDDFCEQPGRILDGSSVKRTCNDYGLLREDVARERAGEAVSDSAQ
jgi:hypothetical protein